MPLMQPHMLTPMSRKCSGKAIGAISIKTLKRLDEAITTRISMIGDRIIPIVKILPLSAFGRVSTVVTLLIRSITHLLGNTLPLWIMQEAINGKVQLVIIR